MISNSVADLPSRAKPGNESRPAMRVDGDRKIVIVIDGDDEMRAALTSALASPGRVIRPYASAEEFLAAKLDHDRPTCIVSEIRLRALSGLGLQKRLQSEGCRVPMIFLSASADVAIAVEAIRAGGFDYLEKPVHRPLLLERIERAFDEDARQLLEDDKRREFENIVASLSQRQRDVYRLLIQGKSNKQIGAELEIGLPTVTRHRTRVLAKFGVANQFQLVARAAAVERTHRRGQI